MGLVKCEHYIEEEICGWDQLTGRERKHRSNFDEKDKKTEWIFKGHRDSNWSLKTTLERAMCNMGISIKEAYEIESGLIRKFQRQFHHYDLRSPGKDDVTEWLALMRHYGAPVRLLDWTYSFYVAVFFAVEEAEGDCAVWALEKKAIINKVLKSSKLTQKQRKFLSKDIDVINPKTWEYVFRRSTKPFVWPVNPFRLNERLVIQQGDFLCQGDISKTFEENLAAVLPNAKKDSDCKLFKYVIKSGKKERKEILLNLHRMNINRATLFPGLDGFAQSLKTLLVSPHNLLKA